MRRPSRKPPPIPALAIVSALAVGLGIAPAPASAQTVLYRVNCGGPALAAGDGSTPGWSADQTATPSPYVNAAATGNQTFSTGTAIALSPSVPASVPMALFQSERWDPAASPEMLWSFPVANGTYEVRLLFAEIYSGAQGVGLRVFNVTVEGTPALSGYDVFADVGGYVGTMKSSVATVTDGNLDIGFLHTTENPAIKGIEVRALATNGYLQPSRTSVSFGTVVTGTTSVPQNLTITNLGSPGDQSITITGVTLTGPFAHTLAPQTLAPAVAVAFNTTFSPVADGPASGTLTITHDGVNSPVTIALQGTGSSGTSIGFGSSVLAGAAVTSPTSIQFGPDGRLYASQQDGTIKAFTVSRTGTNAYAVTATEAINLVKNIPNHNDNGVLNPAITSRQVTGLVVAGTAANPVLYVSSSDPRIGAGPGGADSNLDTNSGMVSRLTWNGASWDKLDLVRGLSRSEENHAPNGLALDPSTQTLYLAVGGHTNQGAPSNNFALLPEYALSAAILSIDLDAIGNTTYDLPTLDDETRANGGPGGADTGDPFGGNDGLNQARLVPGGPVQVHAPGFRNPYDVLWTSAGRLYTVDNGPNGGWGDVPISCTNAAREPGVTHPDNLHFITGPGFYGGHPNPTRGNTANTFNASNPQSPVAASNPVECGYLVPGAGDGALTTFVASTNGLSEYGASNFGGAMQGDVLAAGFDGTVWRMKANAAGTALVDLAPPSGVFKQSLFSGFGSQPLDVTAQSDVGPFPGTVWVAVYGSNKIQVFEPNDYDGGGTGCSGANDPGLDEDADGYSNADEIANGTNPCSAASKPPDWDGDFISNLADPDDDNDGLPDTSDKFAVDAANGTATTLPIVLTWNNDEPSAGGLLDLGFTGLMTNGTSNYEALFDPGNMTAGGAAGVVTVDLVPEGDCHQATNTQQYGFQFGVATGALSQPFVIHTRILGPFAGITPESYQSMGLFVGTGDQDHYLKLVTTANAGLGGLEVLSEIGGVATGTTYGPSQGVAIVGSSQVDLWLRIDPVAGTAQPSFSVDQGPLTPLGGVLALPPAWLSGVLAVGMISTSNGPGAPFPATWDLIEARLEQSTAAATIEVTPTGVLNASTYATGALTITNTSASFEKIRRVRLDLRTALLRDLVFDPLGIAGDLVAKCFTADAGAVATGLVAPGDPCGAPFESPHDGGYDVLALEFTDFAPGEQFAFSLDVDPTSIRGIAAPGPNESGSVSGLELAGSQVTMEFNDGAVLSGELYRVPGSLGGSQCLLRTTPIAAPSIQLLGRDSSPTVVPGAAQTVRVTGDPGHTVAVLVVEGGRFTSGVPGGGFDLDPYEANSAIALSEATAVVGPGGTVDVPVTLTHTGGDGGINLIVAARIEAGLGGAVGPLSNRWVVALGDVVVVSDEQPRSFGLEIGGPNPFHGQLAIHLSLPAADQGSLAVYDIVGRRVRALRDGRVEAGAHTIRWDGKDDGGRKIPSGIYFVRFLSRNFEATRRVIFLP
jgi:hypothetical protein